MTETLTRYRPDTARIRRTEVEPSQPPHYEVAVIGAGPQGLALAHELLKRDIKFALVAKPKSRLSRVPDFGGGLATYDIPANSLSQELLLDIREGDPLERVNRRWSARRLAHMEQPPNLRRKVGKYMRAVGRELREIMPEDVHAKEVHHSVWDGEKHTVLDTDGNAILTADFVSFNIGAHDRSLAETSPRFDTYAHKIKSSLELMKGKSAREIRDELKATPEEDRFVVIVGASHTGLTDAALMTKGRIQIGKYDRKNSRTIRLLERVLPKTIGDYIPEGRLIIATRGNPEDIKVYADSAEDAVREGLESQPAKDIDQEKLCPVTGKYRRFIGFREYAKETYLNWKNGDEPRIAFRNIDEIPDHVLEKAIIVQAVGLESNVFDVRDQAGNSYPLPMRNGVISASETGVIADVPNTYGGGIGVNVLQPDDALGGEPEFRYPNGEPRHLHFVAGYNAVAKSVAEDIYVRRKQET